MLKLRKIACAPPKSSEEYPFEISRSTLKSQGNEDLNATNCSVVEKERLFPRKKKSMNPFIVFRTMACRELSTANPGISNSDISAILGKQWKAMPDSQKQKYRDISKRLSAAKALQYTCIANPIKAQMLPSLKDCLFGPMPHSEPPHSTQTELGSEITSPTFTIRTLHSLATTECIPPFAQTTFVPYSPSLHYHDSVDYYESLYSDQFNSSI
ncbi:hypothetical protein DSO57_1017942 [Entomophthora muscae]|uniref:Uncharacterized protein n=1 Tax=Entomophthora muscae TaxID=34485 RepID=A0ACC2TRR9_9FUNG|nr:hypothetical protein DSO57_1017942 [Entomophthora muscae]